MAASTAPETTGFTPGKLGYQYGEAFGDPSKFTSSTQDDEIDRFNQWLRSQPFHQQFMQQAGGKSLTPSEEAQLTQEMQKYGIPVAQGQVEIDQAGNLHKKSWRERHPDLYGGLITAAEIGAGIASAGTATPFIAAAAGAVGEGYARDPEHPSLGRAALGALSGYAAGGGLSGVPTGVQQAVKYTPSAIRFAQNPSLSNAAQLGANYAAGQFLPGSGLQKTAEMEGLSLSEKALMGQQGPQSPVQTRAQQIAAYNKRKG